MITLYVPGNGNATFKITIDASNVPLGAVRSAMLYLTDLASRGKRVLHIPITFVRQQPGEDDNLKEIIDLYTY